MNKFLKEFKDRGFFYQCTSEDELSKQLDEEKIKGYIGFDCTAESLHVGSLLQISVYDYFKKMDIDQLFYLVEELQELGIHLVKIKLEKY